MNGEITVMSKVGAGSVFEFTLPVRAPDVTEGGKPCCSAFPVDDKRLNGMHVILLDSNLVRQVLLFSAYVLNYCELINVREEFWLCDSLLITIRLLTYMVIFHFLFGSKFITLDINVVLCCRKCRRVTCGV